MNQNLIDANTNITAKQLKGQRMKGYIRKRGDRWVVTVDLPRTDAGKRRQRNFSGFRNYKDAEKQRSEITEAINKGKYDEKPPTPLNDLLDRWLRHIKHRVTARSHERYSQIVKYDLKPKLGEIPLDKLKKSAIEDLYMWLLESGRTRGKGGLSARSVQYTHRTLHAALQFALHEDLIDSNPCSKIRPPSPRRREFRALDEAEVAKPLAGSQQSGLYTFCALAVTSGLRRNELLALSWSDIDWTAGTVSVARSIEKLSSGITFKQPKTAKSRRLVAIPSLTVDILKRHKAEQAARRLAAGPAYIEAHDLVFADPLGLPLNPDTVSKDFGKLARACAFSGLRLHDLRHTAATLMLRQGINPKIVSEMLGHSSIALTMDTYSHVAPILQETAAAKLDTALRMAIKKAANDA